MANPNSQFSPNLQNRYTNTQRSRHTRFDQGMIRDIASWELPEGAVYDAADLLCDYVGKIRKRGGTTSPASGNSTATVEHILGYKSNGVDGTTGLWGTTGKSGATVYSIAAGTGVSSSISSAGSVNTFACRPFQYGNLIAFPFQALSTTTNDRNKLYFGGGGTGSLIGITAGTVTNGDNRITGLLAATFASTHVGSILEVSDGSTGYYIGRIVEVTTASSVRVEPVPTQSITISVGSCVSVWDPSTLAGSNVYSGRFGCTFQNRVVLGYTLKTGQATSTYAKGLDVQPNRIIWSQGPDEAIPQITAIPTTGNAMLYPGPFTAFSYQDVPNLGGMTGLAAVGDGQLAIFGPRSMFRLSGQLTTQSILTNSFSYSVDQVSNNIGCISAKSIQYARGGLIWAGYDNLYEYDGSSLKPLLNGRNQRYFQDRLRAGDTVYGSAYNINRNHYYLSMSGSDGGLMFNLDNLAMTRFTNVQLFDSTPDPSDATKLWGVRWWDTTGAAPTMTKGQLIGLESIWLPTSANKNDADGTAVLSLGKTAAYVNGALASTKTTADVNVTADIRGSGSPTATVKADSKLNVSDASFTTLGTIPAGTSAGSKSFPVGYQIADGPAIEIQIGNDIACDSFELLGLDFGTQARPEEFSS